MQIPDAYAHWLIDHCRYMDLNKLVSREKVIQVRLPELFIPLLCDPPGKKKQKKEKDNEGMMDEEMMTGKREKPVEIEYLIGQREFLLIEGLAGSGKTTLLKHLALSIIQKESGVGLDHFLPVLVFLKDLAGSSLLKKNKTGAEQLLTDYFKNAEAMIGEIYSHPNVSPLVDTPLMLTAACILYHEERKLPEQRAELYEKFTNSLIFKRFEEPWKVMDFFMALARKVHMEKKKRGFDEVTALEVLEKVYPAKKGAKGAAGSSRERFEEIEQKSGLLKLDQGQYDFRHLTFQEFFAAQHIVSNERDFAKAVEACWDDPWHEELIELFIGCLSLKNKGWANGLVQDQLDQDGESRRWRLAFRALLDMPEDVRDPNLVEFAAKRLLEILQKESDPKVLAEAGKILGWLGDPRTDLEEFVKVEGGEYELKYLGKAILKPFDIGKYPVTNRWFGKFIQAGGYKEEKYWTGEGRKWLNETKAQSPRYWHERQWNCPNAPVVGVSWWEADAFCRWLTEEKKDGFIYRLPTEQEWQAAAAGKEGREYPWGEWEEDRCNTEESGIGKTSAVGIFVNGKTPEGVADMSGNVWEWTRSDYESKQAEGRRLFSGCMGAIALGRFEELRP